MDERGCVELFRSVARLSCSYAICPQADATTLVAVPIKGS